jgi:hypothetical protein
MGGVRGMGGWHPLEKVGARAKIVILHARVRTNLLWALLKSILLVRHDIPPIEA